MRDGPDLNESPLDHGILHDLVGHLLRLAYNRATSSFAQEVSRDLTPLQFMILELLDRNPGIRHSRLAEGLGCSASVLTTSLKGLVDSGLVARMAGADQRQRTYRATSEGAAHFAALRDRIGASEARLTAGLSATDRHRLRTLLHRVARPGDPEKNDRTDD